VQNAPVIATELECQFCGWPLIKNGELMCHRSGHTVKATLGQKRIFCPYCRKPKVALAKNDRAICPKCEKGKEEGTPIIKEVKKEAMKREKEIARILDVAKDFSPKERKELIKKLKKQKDGSIDQESTIRLLEKALELTQSRNLKWKCLRLDPLVELRLRIDLIYEAQLDSIVLRIVKFKYGYKVVVEGLEGHEIYWDLFVDIDTDFLTFCPLHGNRRKAYKLVKQLFRSIKDSQDEVLREKDNELSRKISKSIEE